jgi:hypothetical protein
MRRKAWIGAGVLGVGLFVSAGSAHAQLTVGPNVNVTKLPGNQREEAIAINPLNPNQMFLATNMEQEGNFAAFSTDGGVTWHSSAGQGDTKPNDFIIGDGNDTLAGSFGDVSCSWDRQGNLFLSYIDAGGMVGVAVSGDGGQTFQPLPSLGNPNVDQPTITAGAGSNGATGSVWVTYNNQGTAVAQGAAVNGLGVTHVGAFGAIQSIPGGGSFGDVAIGPNGQVAVTYMIPIGGQGPATLFMNLDADGLGAGGFGPNITISSTNVGGFDFIPAQSERSIDAEVGLAFDLSNGAHRGRLYAIYTDEQPDESNDTNIMTRFSDNNGTTWTAPVRVNDDTTVFSQFLPRIAVDPTTGDVGASWYDCRNDAGNGGPGDTDGIPNDDAQFFASVSRNNGASFLPNVKVSAGTSQQKRALPPAPGFLDIDFGDYSGLAFVGGKLTPTWADNSNSTGDNPDGTLSGFDVYVDVVTVAPLTPPQACFETTGSMNLNDRDVVTTPSFFSGNSFTLGADAQVNANVQVSGSGLLRSRARINGSITLSGSLQRQDGTTVTGTIVTGASVPPRTLPTHTVAVGTTDINVSGTQTLTPGTFRDLNVAAGATAILPAGTYNFRSITVQPGGRILPGTGTAAIAVNVQGSLTIGTINAGDRTTIGGAPSNRMSFYANGTSLSIGTDVNFTATLLAPNANAQISSRVAYSGCLATATLVVQPDTTFSP